MRFTVKDDDDVVVNITGWTVQFVIGTTENGSPAKTINGSIAVGTDGVVTVPISSTTDMDDLAPDTDYWYALWRTNSGNKRVLAKGKFVLSPVVRLS